MATIFSFNTIGARTYFLELFPGDAKPERFESIDEPAFVASEALKGYAGFYDSEEIEPVYRVEVRGADLVLTRSKSQPLRLIGVRADGFACPLGSIQFTRDADRVVQGFILNEARIQNVRFYKRM